MEIQEVNLNKTDTCLTYALKRTGLNPNLCAYENINEHFDKMNWVDTKKSLMPGIILLWDKDVQWKWMPVSITKNGVIKSKLVPTGFHFGVYEGDSLISDCTRLHSLSPPSPTLRMREIGDFKKEPDWILIIKS